MGRTGVAAGAGDVGEVGARKDDGLPVPLLSLRFSLLQPLPLILRNFIHILWRLYKIEWNFFAGFHLTLEI